MLRGKLTALNTHIINKVIINNKNQFINQWKQNTWENQQSQSWFFEKIDIIDKFLAITNQEKERIYKLLMLEIWKKYHHYGSHRH